MITIDRNTQTNVVTVAIARELAAFAWAIAITVMPAPQTA